MDDAGKEKREEDNGSQDYDNYEQRKRNNPRFFYE